jgi:hypothetical protein
MTLPKGLLEPIVRLCIVTKLVKGCGDGRLVYALARGSRLQHCQQAARLAFSTYASQHAYQITSGSVS